MNKQQTFNLFKGSHGGRRPKAGRKRRFSKGVSHSRREVVSARTPLHVNFKYKCSIRNKDCLALLKRAVMNARKLGLMVIHYSLQSNHIHLILEAKDNKTLTAGMRSFTVTFAKGLKKGKVQLERYHLHVLRSLQETRNAVHYVLFNEQRHSRSKVTKVDAYSSLLLLPNALELVREFAIKKKKTLVIRRSLTPVSLSAPSSYLLRSMGGVISSSTGPSPSSQIVLGVYPACSGPC